VNLSFTMIAKTFVDEDEYALWYDGLDLEPGVKPRPRQKNADAFFNRTTAPGNTTPGARR
jgi:hypothetical protein